MIGDFILAQNKLSLLMLFGYENQMFHYQMETWRADASEYIWLDNAICNTHSYAHGYAVPSEK